MASDLVSRLRAFEGSDDLGNGRFAVCIEAADTIERYEAAFLRILACTPAAGNVYDCGDPFEQARDALRSQDKGEG